jgi:hypothetical protein
MPETHPTQGIIPIRHFPAPLAQAGSLPSLILNAGENAAEKFIEFLAANPQRERTRRLRSSGGASHPLVRGAQALPISAPAQRLDSRDRLSDHEPV